MATAHQFTLDAPRIRFYADAHRLDSTQTQTLAKYLRKWANRHGCCPAGVMHWCTQTALAPVYTKMALAVTHGDTGAHLLDDGAQTIVFDSGGAMHLHKPFRVAYERDSTLVTARQLALFVTVSATTTKVDWVVTREYLAEAVHSWWFAAYASVAAVASAVAVSSVAS